jgi:peptidyl-prolyl cis-trans isomerase SurA
LKDIASVPPKVEMKAFIQAKYSEFVDQQILAYEEAQLDSKYPAFRALMTEYHDGVLLYKIMNDKVWNKALRDTTGLRSYFNANRNQFKWSERIDADVFVCDTKEIAESVLGLLKENLSAKEVADKANGKSALNVILRSQKFEIINTDYLQNRTFGQGVNSIYEFKGKFYVVVNKAIIPASEKELEETRGAVTAAYQQFLEQKWIQELTAKYAVIIHTDILYKLGN